MTARYPRLGRPCAMLVTLLLMPGCVATQQEPAASFSTITKTGDINNALRGVKRVSLHPSARLVGPAADRSPDRLRADTDAALLAEFRSHGYEIAPAGEGDIEVAYAIGLSSVFEDEALYGIFGLAPGLGSDASESRGAIVLALYDSRLGVVTWRGGMSRQVDEDGFDDVERRRRITDALRRVLDGMQDRQ